MRNSVIVYALSLTLVFHLQQGMFTMQVTYTGVTSPTDDCVFPNSQFVVMVAVTQYYRLCLQHPGALRERELSNSQTLVVGVFEDLKTGGDLTHDYRGEAKVIMRRHRWFSNSRRHRTTSV